jgi:hypothetical protein
MTIPTHDRCVASGAIGAVTGPVVAIDVTAPVRPGGAVGRDGYAARGPRMRRPGRAPVSASCERVTVPFTMVAT